MPDKRAVQFSSPRTPRRRPSRGGRAAGRERRPSRERARLTARRRLAECGLSLEVRHGGAHPVARKLRHPAVDVWPDRGTWAARGQPARRGLRKLLDFLCRNR